MSAPVQGPFSVPGGNQNVPGIGIGIPSGGKKFDLSAVKTAILHAIEIGYRHIQTTISSLSEHEAAGEAVVEALENGLVKSREELFITCKINQYDEGLAGSDNVVRDLKKFIENAHIDYVDLYLIEWSKEVEQENDDVSHAELILLWSSMEECQRLGIAKSVGVCNFTSNMLKKILKHAKTHPSVNQVGMDMLVREKELQEICSANKISIIASSTIGEKENHLDSTQFMEFENSENIGKYGKKTHNEVGFRWAREQGAALLLESFSKEDMQEILNIFK